jgi:hypothetical protein
VVDADSQHFLWTALHWAAVTLNQAERVRTSFEPYRASILSRPDGVVMRVTPLLCTLTGNKSLPTVRPQE